MARYAVRFDRDAIADLVDIRDVIAEARGAAFANAFIERVVAHCESFCILPDRGTRHEAIYPGLRTSTWRRTITIAFIVNDDARHVVVLGAFYRGRDYLAVLAKRLKEVK